MKIRREDLEKEARRLAGVSGLKVYEIRKHPSHTEWYFGIVFRDREICTVRFPWDANKGKLTQVGRTLLYGLHQEELDELNNGEQKLVDADEKEFADFERETKKDAIGMVKQEKGLAPTHFYD